MNRQLSFRTEVSTFEQRYIVNYTDPWFLSRSLPFEVMPVKEERTEKPSRPVRRGINLGGTLRA